jgi:hypothetical protein
MQIFSGTLEKDKKEELNAFSFCLITFILNKEISMHTEKRIIIAFISPDKCGKLFGFALNPSSSPLN